jgi:hypothetical protein
MFRLRDTKLRLIKDRMRLHRTCNGKWRHPSKGAADAAIRSLIRRGLHRPEDGRLHSYPCVRCFRWHVGHSRTGE